MREDLRLCVLVVGSTLFISRAVYGQSLEVGGAFGVGARGSESQLIVEESHAIGGVYASLHWADRFETLLRASWLDLPVRSGTLVYPTPCPNTGSCEVQGFARVSKTFQSPRVFVGGSVLYDFRRGRGVRPFVGGGWGIMRERVDTRCEGPGTFCDAFSSGVSTTSLNDPTGVAGVSTLFGKHAVLRGAVHFHRLGGEQFALFETSLMLGYRF